jgi:hypothetical protein
MELSDFLIAVYKFTILVENIQTNKTVNCVHSLHLHVSTSHPNSAYLVRIPLLLESLYLRASHIKMS